MNQKELIAATAKTTGLPDAQIGKILTAFEHHIARTVSRGEKVMLARFGTFEGRQRKARVARNPQTGGTVKVKARRVPAFKPGDTLRSYVAQRGVGNDYSAAWANLITPRTRTTTTTAGAQRRTGTSNATRTRTSAATRAPMARSRRGQ